MTDVLQLLKPFSWRGVQYPTTARAVSFQHEQADHKIQFRDGEFVEQTGAKDYTFAYTVPMREDIAKGPYKSLFNDGLVKLLADCRNRTPGILYDPVYGEFRCVPTSYNDDTDINKRDGTDVRVEFKHAPEFGATEAERAPGITGINGLVSESGQLDQVLALADWNQQPSPEGTTDILSAINGAGRQVLGGVNKVAAGLSDLAFRLEKIEDTADLAENPQNWQLRNSVRQLRDATLTLNKRVTEDPTQKILRVTTNARTTVSAIAKDLGVTVYELVKSNPGLSRSPMVPQGVVITVIARK